MAGAWSRVGGAFARQSSPAPAPSPLRTPASSPESAPSSVRPADGHAGNEGARAVPDIDALLAAHKSQAAQARTDIAQQLRLRSDQVSALDRVIDDMNDAMRDLAARGEQAGDHASANDHIEQGMQLLGALKRANEQLRALLDDDQLRQLDQSGFDISHQLDPSAYHHRGG
jgi:hypothetical protein